MPDAGVQGRGIQCILYRTIEYTLDSLQYLPSVKYHTVVHSKSNRLV